MNKLLYVIVAVVSMLVGGFAYYRYVEIAQPEFSLYYQNARTIDAFEFKDHNGNSFNNSDLDKKWTWVFFGYTSCPDICPTTLQELNFIYDDLQTIDTRNQVLLVSVDPARDSQERLSQYIQYFNKDFKALRADHGILFPFARNLGLMYAIADGEEEYYEVSHSGSIVLINPDGKVAAIFKPKIEVGQPPAIMGEELLSDFPKIVKLFEAT